jgi:hypothetical protein
MENDKFFYCNFCSYFSNRKFNLTRHLKTHNSENLNINSENLNINSKNLNINSKNLNINSKNLNNNLNNLTSYEDNNKNNENLCFKCNKIFCSKYSLKMHIEKCKGIANGLICQYCNKIFSFYSSKSVHIKKCKMKYDIENNNQNNEILDIHSTSNIITNNNNTINNNTTNNITNNTINNNQTINNNIIIFDPTNVSGKTLKTEHINLDFIKNLIKINENDILTIYTKKILDNPDNRCIRKSNMRSMFTEIHTGKNKWDLYYDNDIYPKFISEISNCLSELLMLKISNRNIIKKLIDFLDYMSDEGYCNQDELNEEIKKKYKNQIQKTKAIIYNISKYIKEKNENKK